MKHYGIVIILVPMAESPFGVPETKSDLARSEIVKYRVFGHHPNCIL